MNRFRITQKRLLLVALLMASLVGRAAEAARMQNYDQWKDLPNKTLIAKGNNYWHSDRIDSALVCYIILFNRYNDKMSIDEKEICCGAATAAGNLYLQYYYDFQTAYRYMLKAEEIAINNDLDGKLAYLYGSMAILLGIQVNLETNFSYKLEVLEAFKEAFHQSVKSRHYLGACIAFGNLAYTAIKHQHVHEIMGEVQTFHALEIPNDARPDDIRFKSYFQGLCDCVIAYDGGKYQEALDLMSQIDDFLPQDESPQAMARDRTMTCVLKYFTLLSLNRDKEALQELDKAESIARDNNLNDAIVECLKLKQDYYETHGNAVMAKEYKLKYFEAKDEFINRSKLLSVEQQKFLIELEEMGVEVKDLEAQKRMRDLVIAGVAIFALMVIAALIYLWRNYLNTRQRNLILYQKNQELLALEQERNMPAEKYKSSPMDEQAKDELLQRIYAVMESHQQIYDEGFTLDQLARLVGANPNYVSQVINEKKGCNFKAFINDYKIKEVCRRLSDQQQYGGLTIEAIGQSVGFKSRTHFYNTFKQFTGMTPAAYQRAARNKPDSPEINAENKSA
ncbi:MAG: helix-turn-helix transcriptional regulator [Muribaculaceae bacterium]|nr:helix-turn-helix transcriptional regulator [Muribaculaceae bacterium]